MTHVRENLAKMLDAKMLNQKSPKSKKHQPTPVPEVRLYHLYYSLTMSINR